VCVGLLTDRSDCRTNDMLGGVDPDEFLVECVGGQAAPQASQAGGQATPQAWRVQSVATGEEMYLVAGRQVITRERIEVLALCVAEAPPDGQPSGSVIEAIHAVGGVPVLSWSPGKWLGKRGRLIRALMDQYGPGVVALGDTTLRPACFPVPGIFRYGTRHGFRVLAGTDALPCAGEEAWLGSYASRFDGEFDRTAPRESMQDILANRPVDGPRGRRKDLFSVATWLILNRMRGRTGTSFRVEAPKA